MTLSEDEMIRAPFFLEGKGALQSHALLLIHGFTSSPGELRALGGYMNEIGYTVDAVRLPGHGTSPQDMTLTGWRDWWGHVQAAYDQLEERGYRYISAVGFSMGGLLGLKLSMERRLTSLITLSAPIFVHRRHLLLAGLGQAWSKYVTRKPSPERALAGRVGYTVTPLPCVLSLIKLVQHVKTALPQVETPIFIGQGQRDRIVQPKSAGFIYNRISSGSKAMKYYDESTHHILSEPEQELLYEDIRRFLGDVSAEPTEQPLFSVY